MNLRITFACLLVGVTLVGSLRVRGAPQDSPHDAVALGRTRDAAVYAAFNADYVLPGAGEVQSVEIITEFRRSVMIVRAHADNGEYAFNENNLARLMPPYRGLVTFVAQVAVHPLNVLSAPPHYEMFVRTGPSTTPIQPASYKREPIYGLGGEDRTMTGFRLELTVARADISTAADPAIMIVNDRADVIWQARLNLSRYR